MKKTFYTLCVDNYEPEITKLTFPLMRMFAKKIGAEFYVITKRKFPEFPCPYEKFQISELSKKRGDEWSIFFDADALIHPNMWDATEVVGKEVTVSNGTDFVPQRFKPDKYFKRDGRFIGKGNWCMMGSDWTAEDLWAPLHDMTPEEAAKRITPMVSELMTVVDPLHLVDDFTVSRNIARYGLQHVLLNQISAIKDKAISSHTHNGYLWHVYLNDSKEKIIAMKRQLLIWAAEAMRGKYSALPIQEQQAAQMLIEKLKTWDGSLNWSDLVSILPFGDKVFKAMKSWGLDIEYLGIKKLSYGGQKVLLMSTLEGVPDSNEKSITAQSINTMPKNVKLRDFVGALPLKDYIIQRLGSWGMNINE
ncbi:MAG: hypothetical protein GY928_20590 [Colwellia sp.]|nr:hypothetical protein [Colwellia sp.]